LKRAERILTLPTLPFPIREEMNMSINKKGNSLNIAGWSGTAVSVLVAGFMAYTGHPGWAVTFGILAIALAIIPHL